MIDYEFHPIANIFPLIDGDDFTALVADVAENGVLEPVWLYEEKILDGRNRWRAAKAANVECPTRDYEGENPVVFAVSLNLRRRHLSESQRAMVAAKLATLSQGARTDLSPIGEMSQGDAADMLNVGKRSVERAREVINEATPEIVAAVEAGAMSVSLAAQVVSLSDDDKQAIVSLADDPKGMVDAARDMVHNHRAQGTGENEWYTPVEHMETVRAFMGVIDLDPASSDAAQRVVQASRYFTITDDGLTQPWSGNVWLNPPYAQPAIAHFIAKMIDELPNITEAIMLTHNYTDTAWFHVAMSKCSAVCFTRGRIGFLNPEGKKAAPTQGQSFFYFGERVQEFAQTFSTFGFVVKPV